MASIASTTPTTVGGFMIPWDQLRPLLPDTRWAVYGAGWVATAGTNVVASVGYEKNDGTVVPLGQTTLPASGKAEIGPYPLRGDLAVGIPRDEPIVSVVLRGALAAAGSAASMRRWTLWLRMTPRNV